MFSQMPLNRPMGAISQFTEAGHEGVAAAIVMMAVLDWRCPVSAADKCAELRWPSLRHDLLAFWHSPWGQYLRSCFGLQDLEIGRLPTCRYY